MARKPIVVLEGMRENRKALKEVEGGLENLKAAWKVIGREAAEDIRGAVPVKTGAWRAAIKDNSTTTAARVEWGRSGSKGKRSGILYAGWREFGGTVVWRSKAGASKDLKREWKPEGRYVYPTARANEDKYARLMDTYVGGLIRKSGLRYREE